MKGINASPGIAIAKALVYQKQEAVIENEKTQDVTQSLEIFDQSIAKSKEQLDGIYQKAIEELGEEEAKIFEAHGMILEDPEYIDKIRLDIEESHMTPEFATKEATEMFAVMFENMDNPYFKERAADIRDVGTRLINNVLGIEIQDISVLDDEVILIAEDLAPSDTAQMDKKKVQGFATDIGGRTSHTAIMARSLEIPAVLGLGKATEMIVDNDIVIVDGIEGILHINPEESVVNDYKIKKEKYEAYRAELAELKELDAVTTDGHKVDLYGNIGSPEDIEGVLNNGGEGVGLYRTEFLYMHSDEMPSEDSQFEAYKAVLEGMSGKEIVIRTLDIGGDKKLPYLEIEEEMNPFLGVRAVRLCFKEIEMFKTQLRAILRASHYGKALIMFPMISSVTEVRQVKEILEECKKELIEKQILFDENIKVGIMVEIPSAAVTADIIAKEVDFFSIGTNDLCQYTLAVDRMNQNISHLYNPFHPAILRLIKNVVDASHTEGKFTGMCGEFAGDPMAALLLLGMGLDEFSMSGLSIPQVKKIIRSVSLEDAKKITEEALKLSTGDEIKELIGEKLNDLNITLI
jgi:phosphotransferase system enzyme I (PtsI)